MRKVCRDVQRWQQHWLSSSNSSSSSNSNLTPSPQTDPHPPPSPPATIIEKGNRWKRHTRSCAGARVNARRKNVPSRRAAITKLTRSSIGLAESTTVHECMYVCMYMHTLSAAYAALRQWKTVAGILCGQSDIGDRRRAVRPTMKSTVITHSCTHELGLQ